MATTTNYGWETPDDTDLVKDGALAQRTTASAIDTSLYTINGGNTPVGLQLIKTQIVSGSVASATITSAFSSTYNNYLITIDDLSFNGGANFLYLRMGTTSTNVYYYSRVYCVYTAATAQADNGNGVSYWNTGIVADGTQSAGQMFIFNPQMAEKTKFTSNSVDVRTSGGGGGTVTGMMNDTSQFTSFTILVPSGSINYGQVRVYGLRN